MLHDHHGEEISRRMRGIRGTDFGPGQRPTNGDYKRYISEDQDDFNLYQKSKLMRDFEPPKPKKPSFWRWLRANPERFHWFLLSALLALAALIAELTTEGILVSTKFSAEQAAVPAVILAVIAILNAAFFIRCWRSYKYSKTPSV